MDLNYGPLRNIGIYGTVWSCTFSSPTNAYNLTFGTSSIVSSGNGGRWGGFPLRSSADISNLDSFEAMTLDVFG